MNIIKALDENKRFGEKGHAEYGWSNKLDEKIVQLFFQLVRTQDMSELNNQFKSIFEEAKVYFVLLTWGPILLKL